MVTPAEARRPDVDTPLHISPGMEVYDTFDHKLGTVAHIHEGPTMAGTPPGAGDVVEVKTGFLGLGKHLFIPRSAVRDVTEGGVFVSASRDEIHRQGWDQRPAPHAGQSMSPEAERGQAHTMSGASDAPTERETWASWDEATPHARALCERRYGTAARWETYEPRYRFAWEAGRTSELADAPWARAEPELRRRWEVLHPDTEWATAAETVRDAWEHLGR
jgi:hypothetical protein